MKCECVGVRLYCKGSFGCNAKVQWNTSGAQAQCDRAIFQSDYGFWYPETNHSWYPLPTSTGSLNSTPLSPLPLGTVTVARVFGGNCNSKWKPFLCAVMASSLDSKYQRTLTSPYRLIYFEFAEVMLPPGTGAMLTRFQPGSAGESPPMLVWIQSLTEPNA